MYDSEIVDFFERRIQFKNHYHVKYCEINSITRSQIKTGKETWLEQRCKEIREFQKNITFSIFSTGLRKWRKYIPIQFEDYILQNMLHLISKNEEIKGFVILKS